MNESKIKTIKEKNLNSTKKIKRALERENSLTLSVLVDLLSRGLNQADSCNGLGINYKLFRYYLGQKTTSTINIQLKLNRASAYSKTRSNEKLLRDTIKTINRMTE